MTGFKGKSAASVEDSLQAAVTPSHSNTVVSCSARSGHEEDKNGAEGVERKEPTPSQYFLGHIDCHSRYGVTRHQTQVLCS